MTLPVRESLDLLRRAREGDGSCVDELLRSYQEPLLARIRLMMGGRARAAAESSDFLQQTLLEVARGIQGMHVRNEEELLRWMTEVARNNIRDEVRRSREERFRSFTTTVLAESDEGHASPSPSSIVERRDEQHRIAHCLERMRADFRQVLELRHFEDLGFPEIGRRMGRSSNAVQLLHAKALVRLGELLAGLAAPVAAAVPGDPEPARARIAGFRTERADRLRWSR